MIMKTKSRLHHARLFAHIRFPFGWLKYAEVTTEAVKISVQLSFVEGCCYLTTWWLVRCSWIQWQFCGTCCSTIHPGPQQRKPHLGQSYFDIRWSWCVADPTGQWTLR